MLGRMLYYAGEVPCWDQWRSLTMKTGGGEGSKTYIPKNFYRTGGLKTYIPKNFYMKTTYITLLSEKFGGSGTPLPPAPFKLRPWLEYQMIAGIDVLNNFPQTINIVIFKQ
ncbi:hypothetical protein Hanom_Chr01g00049631 [Helianthus anomalus]